ncbi:polysaccharide biosynthesis protein [Chloroflexota bacterium]
MKVILVTGGSGFLGRHLVRRLLDKYQDVEIRTISRGETAIRRLLEECRSERLKPVVGDIRDIDSLMYAMRDVDTAVHLAAMKHVDLCEMYPTEAITTDVIGTENLLDVFDGDTFIGMSTDKAIEATSCYGATKLLAERLILDRAKKEANRRYMVIRAGNMLGSTGSVIERWKQQISQSNEITITNPEMTRFFINVETLVDFIVEAMENGENGNIYIPYQKAISLVDLARATIEFYGNEETKLNLSGPRVGEKLHEVLFVEGEKVISSLDSRCSEAAPRLTTGEIKDWLRELEEYSAKPF